jgi:hypothetical protein
MPLFLLPFIGWAKGLLSSALKLLSDPKALLALAGALLVVAVFVQSSRLGHAKADLKTARAALVDPATKRKWQDEASERLRDLTTCRANTSTLQSALDRQNASLAAAEAAGRDATAKAAMAVERARGAAVAAEKARAQIGAPLKAVDACARVQEVDRRLLENLQ